MGSMKPTTSGRNIEVIKPPPTCLYPGHGHVNIYDHLRRCQIIEVGNLTMAWRPDVVKGTRAVSHQIDTRDLCNQIDTRDTTLYKVAHSVTYVPGNC